MVKTFILCMSIVCLFRPGFGQSYDSITMYVFLLDECRICQELAPELNEIYTLTKESGMGFVGFFPNFSSTESGIKKFVKKYRVQYPVQADYSKQQALRFAATILPEVVLWNETKSEVVYRGAVNNLFYAPGKRRHNVTEHYVKNAIFAILEGKYPIIRETEPLGCFINFTEN